MTSTNPVSLLRWSFLAVSPIAAFLSLFIYLFLGPLDPDAEGALQLRSGDERNGYTIEEKDDPFDIIDEEVRLDGYPIQEEIFWKKVSLTCD
jgi:hypothetical protein